MITDALKPVEWVGSSRADLRKFPAAERRHTGIALHQAQMGLKHRDAKPLKGLWAQVPTSWKLSHAELVTPIGLYTQSSSGRPSMFCMRSKRNPNGALKHRNRRLIASKVD